MRVRTFVMFTGQADAALALWRQALPVIVVHHVSRHAEGDIAGQVLLAEIDIAGHGVMLHDSPPIHDFQLTPAVSFFIDVTGPQDLDDAFAVFAADGVVRMPPDNYGFSRRFAWVEDRYGVNWQLNLP
jgi:predicted 3-demethylubiquinone-9 3-methyltransferase (glyoxalase superfamily)